jgi:3-deoxy-D-manno-octulosonic-acid transferase
MEIFYHTIVAVAILAASPFILMRMALSPAFRADLLARLKGGRSLPPLPGCLWIHASSAGEVRAAKILLDALRKNDNTTPTVLSTFTRTGYELAKKENIANVFRLPPDFPLWTHPLFNKLNPSQLILIEAELWPSLLRQCLRHKVPVLLVNGRMSQKSTDRYNKFPAVFRWITEAISIFAMRSQTDAERILTLGVPPEKVQTMGNIKFDARTDTTFSKKDENFNSDTPLRVVFGSTRPGDEGPIMNAILRLQETLPDLISVIAPRHLERCQEIEGLIREYGVEFTRHSQLAPGGEPLKESIILLDTMGELTHYYAGADVAFVGGGFNPRFGGQNILEPAVLGVPVVYGKHMNNFEEEARLLNRSGGGIQIDHPKELYATLHRLLTQPEERNERGRWAEETIRANQGAVQRTVELIEQTQKNN